MDFGGQGVLDVTQGRDVEALWAQHCARPERRPTDEQDGQLPIELTVGVPDRHADQARQYYSGDEPQRIGRILDDGERQW